MHLIYYVILGNEPSPASLTGQSKKMEKAKTGKANESRLE